MSTVSERALVEAPSARSLAAFDRADDRIRPLESKRLLTDSFGRSIADLEDSPIGMGSMSTPIAVFFKPRSVAVIGATERQASAGRAVLVNLMTSKFGGTVHPVNPKHESILGLTSFATVEAVPGRVDLAVIATPAQVVPDVISQCVTKGVRGAIVLSSGFKESGPAGAALEREVLERAR